MMLELSELQKRVEELEKLTNQLAQWVGFSIGEAQKNEVQIREEDKIKVEEDQGQQQQPCQLRRGVAKKSTSGLRKTKKITSTSDPVDDESLSSDDEWLYDDDAVGDPDFDIDMPPSGTGIRIKEEEDSDLDLLVDGFIKGLSKAKKTASFHDDDGPPAPDPEDDESLSSDGELSYDDDIFEDPDFDIDTPPSGTGIRVKDEEESDLDKVEYEDTSNRRYSLRRKNLPNPYIKLETVSNSTLIEMGVMNPESVKKRSKSVPLGNWKCKTCSEVFATCLKLKQHRREVHKGEPPLKKYNCTRCPEMFETLRKRIQHFRDVHKRKDPLVCPHCPEEKRKPFSRPQHLEDHIRSHTGETAYLCQICGKGFKGNRDLKSHMNYVHYGKPRKRLPCDFCEKVFNSQGQLNKHKLMKHTDGGNPLAVQCDQCFRVYPDKNTLKFHVRDIHENRRPYPCGICGQLFKKQHHLKKHIQSHNNPNRRKRGPQVPKPRASFGPVPASHLHLQPGNDNDGGSNEASGVTEDFNTDEVPQS